MYGNKIRAFAEITVSDFEIQLKNKIKEEIEKKGKEYIIGIDENDYINFLINEYTLEPLKIYTESEEIEEPITRRETRENNMLYGGMYEIEIYKFTVKYSFSGNVLLLKVQPNSYTYSMSLPQPEITVNKDKISFSFDLYKKDAEEFKREKRSHYNNTFNNLDNINKFAAQWNQDLQSLISHIFTTLKNKYLAENDFFAAINVKVNDNTNSIFTVPTVKKKIIPQPQISKNQEFSSNPIIAQNTYEDILKVIYDFGKSMEKKPSTYQNKDEESLRDQFLLILETRYDAVTATGETFNRSGKTDILLKYANDGTNVFVAECKFWHGANEFQNAISQLFDRYLTWRDSKTALLMFVKNNDFTNVIQAIKAEAQKHPYFVKENGNKGDSSFSYIFHLPKDKDKTVLFEIIAFHFDKQVR
ncbi:MAG: hypothetical protein MdMp024_0108 [Bacteroidales bacterium]